VHDSEFADRQLVHLKSIEACFLDRHTSDRKTADHQRPNRERAKRHCTHRDRQKTDGGD
jgi:hypothetical protein